MPTLNRLNNLAQDRQLKEMGSFGGILRGYIHGDKKVVKQLQKDLGLT